MTYDRQFNHGADDLLIWVIYQAPRDYPAAFVARCFLIQNGDTIATRSMFTADTLDEARALLPPGLTRFARDAGDDPVIVESWL